jgi:hypothetical protein
MSKRICNKPVRISTGDLARVAAEGVARAVAARESAIQELVREEVDQVSGGAFSVLAGPIIHGGRASLSATSAGLGNALAGGPALDVSNGF